jgi:phosphatidylserine decarboxylase
MQGTNEEERSMSIIDSVRKGLVPIHPEGYVFVISALILGVVLQWVWFPLGVIAFSLAAFCAYFFRDPTRITPIREGLIISPADGKISSIQDAVPPPELALGTEPLPRISVFLNVFDVHINRSPMTGRVASVAYKPGKFINADLDKASEDNERNGLIIETAGVRIGVVQIAGLIARRIVCHVREGDMLAAGERFGLIRFGSRVDVYLPAGSKAMVTVGQRAIAGETVLADLANADPKLTYRVS